MHDLERRTEEKQHPWHVAAWLGLAMFFIFSAFSITYKTEVFSAQPPPDIITYQGKLLSNGGAVSTTQDIAFMFYDALTGGGLVYTASGTLPSTTTLSVTPTSGIFSVDFGGSGTKALPVELFTTSSATYLEVVVNGTAMSPRKQLTSVPYAINSRFLMGVTATTTSSSEYIPISDAFGNFNFTGSATSSRLADAVLYVNPTTTQANASLFSLAVNGSQRFRVDSDGDVFVSSTLNVTGSTTLYSELTVRGNLTVSSTSKLIGKIDNLTQVGSLDIDGAGTSIVEQIFYADEYLYIANALAGWSIVDVRDPINPVEISNTIDATSAKDIVVQGKNAYVLYNDGLYSYDISNPYSPVLADSISSGNAMGLSISGGHAFVSNYNLGISIFDISDTYNLTLVSSLADPSDGWSVHNTVVGKYMYVANNARLLLIVDISDPTNPVVVKQVGGGIGAREVAVEGDYAYVADSTNGLKIVDVSDPPNAAVVATIDNGQALGVQVAGGYAYVANSTGGTIVLDVSSSTNPVLLDSAASSQADYSVDVGNNYIYVGDGEGLIRIYDADAARISNAIIGSATISNLTATGKSWFGQDVSIRSGLTVGNNGLWLGGDFSMNANTSTIFATNTLHFSHRAYFTASSTAGPVFVFESLNTIASSTATTLFSIRNNGENFFSIQGNGDARVNGNLFASSTSIGTPGAPGDLAERVDIALDQIVEPGDVVVVDPRRTDTYKLSDIANSPAISGVISTNPTIIVGNGKTENTAAMALTGRLPVKVTDENGSIQRGDLLVSASLPGYAMKYDADKNESPGVVGVIGMALEPLESGTGKIMGLVRTGWVGSQGNSIASLEQDLFATAEGQGIDVSQTSNLGVVEQDGRLLQVNQNLDLNGFYITNVAGLFGKNDAWQIDEQGHFITKVDTDEGKTPLYALQSKETEYVFSGTGELVNGVARIDFDSLTSQIIDASKTIKVNVTLTAPARGVYVSQKDAYGFTVEEVQEGESNATFDWVVIAQRRGAVSSDQINEGADSAQSGGAPPADGQPADELVQPDNGTQSDVAQVDQPDEQTPVESGNENVMGAEEINVGTIEAPVDAGVLAGESGETAVDNGIVEPMTEAATTVDAGSPDISPSADAGGAISPSDEGTVLAE